ncbi:MAG: YheC/YheD family protein [Bacillota bacterium]|nr:hypothetical protein [Bacillota bacterium]
MKRSQTSAVVTVQTKAYPEPLMNGVLSINPQLLKKLNLRPGALVALAFGQRQTKVHIAASHHHKQLVLVDAATAQQLCLEDGYQLNLRYDPKINTLTLGPLFCILIDPVDSPTVGLLRPMLPFLKTVTRYGQKRGILVFVASPLGVKPEQHQISGWHLRHQTWKAGEFPLPDVCYNRISSRTIEQAQETQAILQYLDRSCHFFNKQFLNKWQVHQILSRSEAMRHVLPETRLYETLADLKDMVQKYRILYLKPANGSLGRGIIRLVRQSDAIHCQYATVSAIVHKKITSSRQLLQFFQPRLSRQPYLIQEGLKLASFQGRPVDFRILTQKDGNNQWRVTSMVARAAQNNTVVTNVARGGDIYNVKTVLPYMTHHSVQYAQQRLRQLAIAVARELEAQLDGTYAEFGIDVAMDIYDNLWLLEVNAKPSKDENSFLGKDQNRPSVRYLLQYVLYASKHQRGS